MTIFRVFISPLSSDFDFDFEIRDSDFDSVFVRRFECEDVLKMTRNILVIFAVLAFCKNSHQHSRGAPESRCTTLAPGHGVHGSQEFPSPFDIIPSVDVIRPGDKMSVEIKSVEGDRSFRGFLLQARTLTTPFEIVGQFQEQQPSSVNFLDCSGGLRTAITHTTNADFTSRTFEWMAPTEFEGSVRFQ